MTNLEKLARNVIQALKQEGLNDFDLVGLFIAGGAIRSTLLGEDVQDIDIFAHNQEQLDKVLGKLNVGWQNSENCKYKTIYISPNPPTRVVESLNIQIIKVKAASPQEVIGEFDFVMNMNYIELGYPESAYIHCLDTITSKTLTINKNCRNKLGTLARLEKFLNRGYKIGSRNNLLMLGTQISKMEPVSTFSQLEDDSRLYFTFEQYEDVDFVEKDAGSRFSTRYAGSGF